MSAAACITCFNNGLTSVDWLGVGVAVVIGLAFCRR